jgi:hypothetical protein
VIAIVAWPSRSLTTFGWDAGAQRECRACVRPRSESSLLKREQLILVEQTGSHRTA